MKVSRNDHCPCGSGKKYKKCCMNKRSDDSDDVAKQDWRLRAVAALAKPFLSPWTGEMSPVGTAVIQSSSMQVDGSKIGFCVPSAPALFLDLSKKARREAIGMKSQPTFVDFKPGKSAFIDSKNLFDFLEQMMASVVFAYTAIESFANLAVPENYIHKEIRKDGRCAEESSKEQIERFFSLEKKLELMPLWLTDQNITSPKGTALWEKFKKLEALRDRIIHLKTADLKTSNPTDPAPDSIWQELIAIPDTHQVANELIKYYSGTKPPRWLWKFEQT